MNIILNIILNCTGWSYNLKHLFTRDIAALVTRNALKSLWVHQRFWSATKYQTWRNSMRRAPLISCRFHAESTRKVPWWNCRLEPAAYPDFVVNCSPPQLLDQLQLSIVSEFQLSDLNHLTLFSIFSRLSQTVRATLLHQLLRCKNQFGHRILLKL